MTHGGEVELHYMIGQYCQVPAIVGQSVQYYGIHHHGVGLAFVLINLKAVKERKWNS